MTTRPIKITTARRLDKEIHHKTIYHHRVAHPRIQFHSLHPPPFAVIRKGLSLTDSYSGATRHSGRFSEGLLLRRSHIEACATSHYWAREIAKFGHEVRRDCRRVNSFH